MKKILFISYYWPPSGGAGVQRSLKFVKYLSDYGIEPIVITVDSKYASYPLHDETLLKEISDKIIIRRTKSFEALKVLSFFTNKKNIPHGGFSNSNKEKFSQKMMRYIRGNIFIPDARIGWIRFAEKAASEIIKAEGIDTVFITSPPHSSQLIGLRLKKKFNVRWIADMRDPWTDIYYKKDLLQTKSSTDKDAAYELSVLKGADEIITVSQPINELFLNKSSELSTEKFHVIPNGYDETDFQEKADSQNGIFYITYVGSIADTYKPDVFFEVLKRISDEFGELKIRLRIVGSLPDSIRQLIEFYEMDMIIDYISHVSHDKAVKFMQESSVLLLLIPDTAGNSGILTGKLFEYLAARRPIIGLGPVNGSAASIINECEAGKMFERFETENIYAYLKSLILRWEDLKDLYNASKVFKKYSRRALTAKLADIILKKEKV